MTQADTAYGRHAVALGQDPTQVIPTEISVVHITTSGLLDKLLKAAGSGDAAVLDADDTIALAALISPLMLRTKATLDEMKRYAEAESLVRSWLQP